MSQAAEIAEVMLSACCRVTGRAGIVATALLLTISEQVRSEAPTGEPTAAIQVWSDRFLAVGDLRDGAPIHPNRDYAFLRVPRRLSGHPFTMHDHRNPGTLRVEVTREGTLALCLWGQDAPGTLRLGPRWRETGHLFGLDTTPENKWRVYVGQVRRGEIVTIPTSNRWGSVLVAARIDVRPSDVPPLPPPAERASQEYQALTRQIEQAHSGRWDLPRLERESVREEALIHPQDRDPLDVVLRRTGALLQHLRTAFEIADVATELAELEALADAAADTPSDAVRKTLFLKATALRRRVAFRNPLLDFDAIVFLKRHRQARGDRHMIDQYNGHNARAGGGVYILRDPFGEAPTVDDLLNQPTVDNREPADAPLRGGAFLSLDLDYDARAVAFAWTQCRLPAGDADWQGQHWSKQEARAAKRGHYYWSPETTYHVFTAAIDGTGVRQLTDGPWNDFDPCFLPDGDLVFVSERRGGYARCSDRPSPSATIHRMRRDGTELRALSKHETNEWHPSVVDDGTVVYTRWDYVDRDSDVAHHPWTCRPDGGDPRALHGNYPGKRELRPWMVLSIRSIPGSACFVATAAPHHGEAFGSLVVVDPRREDDGAMGQVRRLTPEIPLPESEKAPGVPHSGRGRHSPRAEVFGTPWPLDRDFYLCVYDLNQRNYGIYLIDSFGNRELLCRDPQIPCLDPIPLRARPRPPIIPPRATPTQADAGSPKRGTVALIDVYASDFAWPEHTDIRSLRIVQVFPKDTIHQNQPRVGLGAQSLARGVLGTVPVSPDGSAHFTLPADVPVYFQAIDSQGLAVQSMRSVTYVKPGQRLVCLGCHEPRRQAPDAHRTALPAAFMDPPSEIRPGPAGSYPLLFPRLVQGVVDKHCLRCHDDRQPQDGKRRGPDLRGDAFGENGWSNSFIALAGMGFAFHGGNGALNTRNKTSRSLAGDFGALGSRLLPMLRDGHHDVSLPAADLRRITLWLDCNTNFYGAYHQTERQARGETVTPRLQ